jgi:hypothetical protein
MTENYFIKIVLLIVVFLILGFFYLRYFEKRNLYFPLRTIEATPEDINLDYESVTFMTKDGVQLVGWFIPAKTSRATLIFCHGNGGNISHRLEKIRIFNNLNLDVLIFDYRGYGMSEGSPSEKGLYLDAEVVYNYLVNEKRITTKKIVVYGESLGAAVAVDLASKHDLAGIIIEGGFTSVKDMAKKILPFIPTFIYASRFDSLEKIKNIKSPKLIFHSVDDEIVPFELGKKLFDAAAEPKEFVELRGGHNDAFLNSQDMFITKIDSFINRRR